VGPVDFVRIRQRKRDMVEQLVADYRANYDSSDTELIIGNGHFTAPRSLEVHSIYGAVRSLHADRVIINAGTRATLPDIPGLTGAAPMTHIEALEMDTVPDHLIVIGGGYVGMELAQMFRRVGAQVNIVQRGPRLVAGEDADVSAALHALLQDEGVRIILDAELTQVRGQSEAGVETLLRTAQGPRSVIGSHLLMAVGRTPNTADIGLGNTGVRLDSHGYIRVNEYLETGVPNVWAAGDCIGSPLFTHVAYDDMRVIRASFAGGRRSTVDRLIPYCVFTDPPLGRVGVSESEARAAGQNVRVASMGMHEVMRALTLNETTGFMKIIVAADSDDILGFTMLGPESGEVTAVVQMAMLAGMPYPAVRDAIIAHPTMAEGLNKLLASVPPRRLLVLTLASTSGLAARARGVRLALREARLWCGRGPRDSAAFATSVVCVSSNCPSSPRKYRNCQPDRCHHANADGDHAENHPASIKGPRPRHRACRDRRSPQLGAASGIVRPARVRHAVSCGA